MSTDEIARLYRVMQEYERRYDVCLSLEFWEAYLKYGPDERTIRRNLKLKAYSQLRKKYQAKRYVERSNKKKHDLPDVSFDVFEFMDQLTDRQVKIVMYMMDGYSGREIAKLTEWSENIVYYEQNIIRERLEQYGRTD